MMSGCNLCQLVVLYTIMGERIVFDLVKAIHEYVKDIPSMKSELHQVKASVDEIGNRLKVV